MQTIAALQSIRSLWIARVSGHLSRGEGVRRSFQVELESLFDALVQVVETGDINWLTRILDNWVQARPESNTRVFESTLPPILQEIITQTYDIVISELDSDTAIALLGTILVVFTQLTNYVAVAEAKIQTTNIQSELEKAQLTLEKLDKSKSDFISIAAHELKTPLTLIEGYSAMLHERMAAGVSLDEVDILLKGIQNGTRRLKEIVDDMIDVSLIDNNLMNLNFQPVWIHQLLEIIRSDFRATLSERQLELDVVPFPGIRELTFGDNERLYQAFRNLLLNSVKFTPNGGKIRISGRTLPGFIEVTIADTGIGIDPQDHIRIFEKFGQLGNASLHSSGKTKFKGGGAGLGLPITKGIIEAHGGTIWVESEARDERSCPGTIFHVLLPIRKSPPDAKIARLFQASSDMMNLEETL